MEICKCLEQSCIVFDQRFGGLYNRRNAKLASLSAVLSRHSDGTKPYRITNATTGGFLVAVDKDPQTTSIH